MPSTAALNYFSTFTPEQQAQIRASWGGADLMDQWYNNAVSAGAVPGQGGAPEQQGATGPTQGKPTAAWVRQYATQQGWPEDYARFDDATLQGWINQFWDPTSKKFRSARGAEGTFYKPTDCPEGQVPSGPNENSPCAPPKPGAGPAPPVAAANADPSTSGGPGDISYTGNPLVDMLIYQFNNRQSLSTGKTNIFGFDNGAPPDASKTLPDVTGQLLEGGGLWWGPKGSNLAAKKPTAETAMPAPQAQSNAVTQMVDTLKQPDVTQQPSSAPVVNPLTNDAGSPLQQMLMGQRKKGAFNGLFAPF